MSLPSNPLEWILAILLFIISLGVLITLHELGHLAIAKAFNVYCREFSIGFGPAFFRKRRKGGETYVALRAIPLGGYVSMYDEESESVDDEDVTIPHNRSLNGIARPKRALIYVAGVVTNAFIALVLFAISNIALPNITATNNSYVTENSIAAQSGIKDNDKMYVYGQEVVDPETETLISPTVYYEYKLENTTYAGYFWVIDPNITIGENHYVMTYYPTGTKNYTKFTDGISLYPADKETKIRDNNALFSKWHSLGFDLPYYPDYTKGRYELKIEISFDANLYFRDYLGKNDKGENTWAPVGEKVLRSFHMTTEGSGESYKFKEVGLEFKTEEYWLDFSTRVENTFIDFVDAATMVFRGLGMLFTQGIGQMSGIVGIFQTSASIMSSYGEATYLFFWGLISVNLAIFNLLPFPGLDGWALLVTAIEGSVNAVKRGKYKKAVKAGTTTEEYKEWLIPTKVKSIISMIGLGLLFLLMIAVVILDVLRIAGLM